MYKKFAFCIVFLLSLSQLGWARPPQQTQTIRACAYENAPKIYTNEHGEISGFWVELLNHIAAQEGWQIEWVHGEWEDCLNWLKTNEVDIVPDMGWTESRAQIYDFSEETVLISWTRVYIPEGSQINTLFDLEGKTVGALKGSFNLDGPEGLKDLTYQFGIKTTFVEMGSYTEIFEALEQGELDAAITNKDFGNLNESSYRVKRTPIIFQPARIQFAFTKGAALTPYLIERIDSRLAAMKADGNSAYYQALDKYLSSNASGAVEQVIPNWVFTLLVGAGGVIAFLAAVDFISRKQVQARTAELLESQSLLAAIADSTTDAIFVKNAQGKYILFNHGAELTTGKKAADAMGQDDHFILPDLANAIIADDQKIITDGRVITYEESIPNTKGERRTFLTTKGPIFNKDKSVLGLFGIARDITERKRAEDALRASEEFSKTVLNSSFANIAILDRSGQIISTNKAWQNFARDNGEGKIVRAEIGVNYFDVCKNASGPNSEESAQALQGFNNILSGSIDYFDLEYPCHSSTQKRWFLMRAVPLQTKDGGLVVSHINITERKQAEEKKQHYLSQLMALNKTALHLQKLQPLKILANEIIKSVEATLNYTYGAVLLIDESGERMIPFAISSQKKDDKFINEDKQYIESHDIRVGKGMTGWVAETGQIIRSGNVQEDLRYYGLRNNINSELCVPLKLEELVIGVINIESEQADAYSESDERVLETVAAQAAIAIRNAQLFGQVQKQSAELEQRVTERTAQLQSINKELESFSYLVSHDLRAPLRAITGFAEIINRRHSPDLNEEGRHYFDNIVQASKRMGNLIDDLLTYSRLGRGSLKIESISMQELCDSLTQDFAAQLKEQVGTLTVAADLPTVQGDRSLLNQIFVNLLENALTYHKSNTPPHIRLDWKRDGDNVILSVSDNGVGIPAEHHEKIFNIFQRLHSEDEFPGTGIGLASVKKSAGLLGGDAWVESEVGKGSTFYVRLVAG